MTNPFSPSMTPTSALRDGERVVQSFQASKEAYWRSNAWLAAFGMAAGMGILWAMGNAHAWTGAVGALAAVAVRAFYVASDEMQARWDLTTERLLGPQTRAVDLGQITTVRTLGSAVQIITKAGDKHLLKYQGDPAATVAALKRATGAS
ncbi:MAG: hypothetical protein AAFQ36_00435 [Pseudomonadota bacterium]